MKTMGQTVVSVAAVAAALFASAPAASQTVMAEASTPIVVSASAEQRSAWKRAETDHLVVYSSGSESELRRTASNLERLYYLMSRVFGRGDAPDDTIKLQVSLTGDEDFMHRLNLRNTRSAEGPYPAPFDTQRYYDPRLTGAVLAVSRLDTYFDPAHRQDQDDDMAGGFDEPAAGSDVTPLDDEGSSPLVEATALPGMPDTGTPGQAASTRPPPAEPELRPWEAALYSGFAQHYLLTYHSGAYPRWYLDGAALCSRPWRSTMTGQSSSACRPKTT